MKDFKTFIVDMIIKLLDDHIIEFTNNAGVGAKYIVPKDTICNIVRNIINMVIINWNRYILNMNYSIYDILITFVLNLIII